MITSKQIINLSEEWFKSIQVRGKSVDLFVNPASSDISELYKKIKGSVKEVRFIADAKAQKIYVWKSDDAIHNDVFKDLGMGTSTGMSNVVHGYGKIVNNKIICYGPLETVVFGNDSTIKYLAGFIEDVIKKINDGTTGNRFETSVNNSILKLIEISNYDWQFLFNTVFGTKEMFDRLKTACKEYIIRK